MKSASSVNVPNSKIFLRAGSDDSDLAGAARRLLEAQQSVWPQLAEGVASLGSVRVRELRVDRSTVQLQFNPVRIVSTSAKVDADSIRQRRCFLCVPHLPQEQQGILVLDAFLILCNPAPIFHGHFTISHIEHRAQQLEGNIGTMLTLARSLSPTFTVFYNGPRCGASAPDHLHFQACPSGAIPVERDAVERVFRGKETRRGSVRLIPLVGMGRGTLVLEGREADSLQQELGRLLGIMRTELGEAEEPRVNILCSHADGEWRLTIFPRRKHRPDAFFREGDDRVMISPAAVDIGGLVVTPLERDFLRTDAQTLAAIFEEVSVSEAVVQNIIGAWT